MGSENIEYLIWKLLYGWYGSQVLPFQSFQKYISVKSLYKACDIDFQMTEIYKKRALQEAAFPSDKSELQSYSRDVYDIGVSEAAHILAKGTPVIRDHQPQQLDGRQERLLYEEKLLDTIRRERCMQ